MKNNDYPWVDRINELIDEHDVTKKEIAISTKVSQTTITSWTREEKPQEPKVKNFHDVAKYFGVSMDYLFGADKCRTHEKHDIHNVTGLSDKALTQLINNIKTVRESTETFETSAKRLAVCNLLLENMDNTSLFTSLYDYFMGTVRIQNSNGDIPENFFFITRKLPSGKDKKVMFSDEIFSQASFIEVQHDLMELKRKLKTEQQKEAHKDWIAKEEIKE